MRFIFKYSQLCFPHTSTDVAVLETHKSKKSSAADMSSYELFSLRSFLCYILTLDRAATQEMHLCK